MGSCIICGTSVDGHICDIHEEDAVFEFEGTRADQLNPGRFYQGSVDGFADFGVFIDIGDSVTGLLHRSELDRRLESLDWESGDTVYVQVTGVHDNGNVDLAWSIRQADEEFRGQLVDSPDGDRLAEAEEEATGIVREKRAGNGRRAAEDRGTDVGTGTGAGIADPGNADSDGTSAATANATDAEASEDATTTADASTGTDTGTDADTNAAGGAKTEPSGDATAVSREAELSTGSGAESESASTSTPARERIPIDDLDDRIGDAVRIEGEVLDLYQTGGPTIFEIGDETGSVECAAFKQAGVRAYPGVEIGDVVRLDGLVERHNGDLQVETEAFAVLDESEREAIEGRLDDALDGRAEIAEVPLPAEGVGLEAFEERIEAVATAIRRAVFDARPIQIKHSATAEGYAAGAAIERAVLPLVRDEHGGNDAAYHYLDRRPLEDEYDMNEATGDVTRMLTNRERHGERLPLLVFADAGGTRESRDGFDLLSIYDAPKVVIDAGADPEVEDSVDALLGSPTDDGAGIDTNGAVPTSGALATAVALAADPGVESELAHIPAVSYRSATANAVPESYIEAATEAGYDEEAVRRIGEALTLIAYYQSYDDKRELVADLLFDRADLAEPIAERYREELGTEIDTASANVEKRTIEGVTVSVLDTDAFAHGYDFPPVGVLLDELHRRRVADGDPGDGDESESALTLTVGLGEDELRYRASEPTDEEAVAARVREDVPEAGLSVRGGADGRFEFLVGERETVAEALYEALANELSE
jgi:RecJ-like exonuclease